MNKKDLSIKYPFSSKRYKLAKWLYRYFDITTILDIFANLIIVIIMCLAYSQYPNTVLAFGITYLVLLAARSLYIIHKKKSLDQLKRQAIHKFLHHMNKNLFKDQIEHRFTLFTVNKVNHNYITPYVRFRVGGIDGIIDADQSKARYLMGSGYTGMAWEKPRKYHYCPFPEFKDRAEFEYYYTHDLRISENIVKDISDYMVNVRQIFCYGFVDSTDQFLGVLSLDSTVQWYCKPEEMLLLNEMLGVLRALLESILKYR